MPTKYYLVKVDNEYIKDGVWYDTRITRAGRLRAKDVKDMLRYMKKRGFNMDLVELVETKWTTPKSKFIEPMIWYWTVNDQASR